jgi:hypothetical protein
MAKGKNSLTSSRSVLLNLTPAVPTATVKSKGARKRAQKAKKKDVGQGYFAPTASTLVTKTGKPSMTTTLDKGGDARVRVRHREYIGEVVSTGVAFQVTSYPINPALVTTFPWLHNIAEVYESYVFKNLQFHYETECSTNTAGSVMLGIDYDAQDAAPVSKQQLMTYHGAVRSACWNQCCFSADSQDLHKFGIQRYMRSGAVPGGSDIKTYDVGTFYIALSGVAAGTVGELYVSYDLELCTPQVNAVAQINNLSGKASTVTGTIPNPFQGAVVTGGLALTAGTNVLTLVTPGEYIVSVNINGTGLTNLAAVSSDVRPAANVTICVNNTGTFLTNSWLIAAAVANTTVTFTLTGTTNTGCIARVSPYLYSLA